MQFEGVQSAVDEAGSTPDALAAPNPSRRASRNQAEASTAEPGERVLAGRVADGRRQEGVVGADQAVGGDAGDREVSGRG